MAKDIFHYAVRAALEADGWIVTDDPYRIKALDTNYEVDIGAEKIVAAERNGKKIAVEVKTFAGLSFTYEFHGALGQYLNYAAFMELQDPDRVLFLAVSTSVYENYFQHPAIIYIVEKFSLNIIIFDPNNSTITQWLQK